MLFLGRKHLIKSRFSTGKDSFDNIWKRITKTIETKPDTEPTEKNRSPTPQPEELAVETKKEGN